MAELLKHLDSPDMLKQLIDNGINVRQTDQDGASALHLIAAKHEPVLESAELLLDAGVPLDELDNRGRTPLFTAVYQGSIETVSWLLDHGASIDVPGAPYTPLQAASHWSQTDVISVLLKAGANPNVSTAEACRPPLVQAMGSEYRLQETVALLLDHGADPTFAGFGNETPLFRAAEEIRYDHDPKPEKIVVITMLFEAADRKETPLSQQDIDGAFSCLRRYNREVFTVFLERGANVNGKPGVELEPKYTRPLIVACENEDIGSSDIEWLVQFGADPNLTDGQGRSPIHAAARNGVVTAVQPLLNAGAIIDKADASGRTALHEACYWYRHRVSSQSSFDTVSRSLRKQSIESMTERDFNSYSTMVITNIRDREKRVRHLKFIEALLDANASLIARDKNGATAMHLACTAGDMELVNLILKQPSGRYILVDRFRRTPLHYAAESGATDIVRAMISQPLGHMAQEIVMGNSYEQRADRASLAATKKRMPPKQTLCYGPLSRLILPHVLDHQGQQALHLATAAGKTGVIEALLERPDLQLTTADVHDQTPLYLAESGNHLGSSSLIRAAIRRRDRAEALAMKVREPQRMAQLVTLTVVMLTSIVVAAVAYSLRSWLHGVAISKPS